MGISKAGLLSFAAAVALAGCQSTPRLGDVDNGGTQPLAPLQAAPQGSVQSSNLGAPQGTYPSAPGSDMNNGMNNGQNNGMGGQQGGTQVASLPPASAQPVTAGGVAGVWNASLAGQSCRIATPQTKYGQGYRAGPLRCPGTLANLASWSVNGKQLVLYDANGSTLASLYSTGPSRFDGQTTTGQQLSLSR